MGVYIGVSTISIKPAGYIGSGSVTNTRIRQHLMQYYRDKSPLVETSLPS